LSSCGAQRKRERAHDGHRGSGQLGARQKVAAGQSGRVLGYRHATFFRWQGDL